MDFKVLLVVDNAPGHPESLKFTHPQVEVVFLPPNTTSLIQPLDQGVIRTFKAHYTRRSFARIRSALEHNPELDVVQSWKEYSILDCISNIKESMEEIKPETVNACWRKLWPDCVNDLTELTTLEKDVNEIVEVAHELGGEGFADMTVKEIEELIDGQEEETTNEDLEELVKSEEDDDDDEDDLSLEPSQPSWNVNSLGELFRNVKVVTDFIVHQDPSMERSLKIVREINQALGPYTQMLKDLKRKHQQLPITMFFSKSAPSHPDSSTSPQRDAASLVLPTNSP